MTQQHACVLDAVVAEQRDGFAADSISVARRTGLSRRSAGGILLSLWQRSVLGKGVGGAYWLAQNGGRA